MATETYTYFKPDPDLRAAYGGGAIQNNGDSAELTTADLCQRAICREIGKPSGHTQFLFRQGVATDTFTWLRVPSTTYTAASAHLTAAELATATPTMPSGFTLNSIKMKLQPHPYKTNIILRGDSITDGLGTTTGDSRDIYATQGINLIETLTFTDTVSSVYREAESANYCLRNYALGSSSWDNTIPPYNDYPRVEALAYAQRTQTIPMDGPNNIFVYWLGTNDLSYDGTLTGAACWARAAARIAILAAEFPNLKIIIGTVIKRSELSALNNRIGDYNVALRAGYLAAGAHVLMDFEALVPQVNLITGDTTNTTYYTDGTHITTACHALLAPVFRDSVLAAEALL